MSFDSSPSRCPSLQARTLVLLTLPLLLLMSLAGSSFAQSTPGDYGPGMDQPGGEHAGRRGGGERMMMPTQQQLEGPAAPDTVGPLLKLSQDELQHYTRRYDNHMALSKATRDSLRTAVQQMRSAFELGDHSATREQRQAVERQWEDLSARDTEFDRGLKDVFTKDQEKQFNKWKQEREKADREQQHHHGRRPAPGGGENGWM